MELYELVRVLGFDSVKEFHSLVASVDISTREKNLRFLKWRDWDGSKKGLLEVIEKNKDDTN